MKACQGLLINIKSQDAYVTHADSMTPYYPNLDEEKLQRHELAIVL